MKRPDALEEFANILENYEDADDLATSDREVAKMRAFKEMRHLAYRLIHEGVEG